MVAKRQIGMTDKEHKPGESKSEPSVAIGLEKERAIVGEKRFTLEDFIAQSKRLNKNVNPDRFKHSSDIFPNK